MMETFANVLANPELVRLGLTLVHFLWQGASVAILLAILLMLLRGAPPNLRYSVSCVALFAVAVLPFITFYLLTAPTLRKTDETSAVTTGGAAPVFPESAAAPSTIFTVRSASGYRPEQAVAWNVRIESFLAPTFPWLALGWFVGVIALSLRLLGGCIQAERLKRRNVQSLGQVWEQKLTVLAEKMQISKAVTLLESSIVSAPVLIGWVRPVILFPISALAGLPMEQLEAVLAHELAHVKRGDYLIHIMQTAIEVLLFYHPAVWWVSRQVTIEREHACDDLAAAACGDTLNYARALTELAQVSWAGPRLALAAQGGSLFTRIRRLASPTASGDAGSTAWLPGGMIVSVAALLLFLTVHMPATAVAQGETPAPAAPPAPARSVDLASAPVAVPAISTPAKTKETGKLSVAVLEFNRLGADSALAEIGGQLSELVSERLSSSSQLRLVERTQLTHTLQELKFDQTGLVDSDTAAQVGRVVGARFFVSGKLMTAGEDCVCTVRLIDTQTSEVAMLRVKSKPSDGVLQLADAVADAALKRLAAIAPDAGTPPDTEQASAIVSIRTQLANRPLPVVAVSIPESHIGTWAPDPAGENELISVLTRAGYRVVDITSLMKREPASWWARLIHGSASGGSTQGNQFELTSGFQTPADIMKNAEIEKIKQNVDLLIIGEAFSEAAGENYGFNTCTARMELRVIDTKTETVACAASEHSSAADLSEHAAGKKALRHSGGILGVKLAKDMSDYWNKKAATISAPSVTKP